MPQIITVTPNTAIDRVLEVPDFTVGGHISGKRLQRYPGGKGINVSRALAKLGRDSIVTGFVGRDEYDAFDTIIHDTGPGRATCQLFSVNGTTRENITIIDPANQTDTHIREAGFELTEADRNRLRSKVGLLAGEQSVVTINGSLPPGMDTADLALVIDAARVGGSRVVLDLAGDVLKSMFDHVQSTSTPKSDGDASDPPLWMITPNLDELAEMLGLTTAPAIDDVPKLTAPLTNYVRWVVVTLGPDGVWLVGADQAWRGRIDLDNATTVVNTVGCGDCLLAGMLDGLAAGAAPERMLRLGLAAATANALTPAVAEFDRSQVDELAQSAYIENVTP